MGQMSNTQQTLFRLWRERLGLTLAEVADKCGCSRQMIHKIETGNPTVNTLERAVCIGLGVSMDDFFSGGHDEEPDPADLV